MSDTNRLLLSYAAETGFGEDPPNPAPTLQDLPFTSESFRQETNARSSTTIRNDRQIADISRLGLSASGDLGFELQYGAYDDFLMAVLQSAAWSSAVTVASTDTAVSVSSGTFVHGTGWDNNPAVGDWIEVRGFTDSGNNGYFKVASVSSTVITPEVTATLVDEAAGDSIDIATGPAITNGTTFASYVFEKHFQDLTTTFAYYVGCSPATMSLNIATDALITGQFGFLGVKEVSATATKGDGSNTVALTNQIMNNVDHVLASYYNATATDITSFTMNIDNNLRQRLVVGTLGPKTIGSGKFDLSGTLTAYFETATAMNAYLNFTQPSYSTVIEDDAGNAYIIDIPAIKFSGGQRVAGGENTDIMAELNWMALRDSTEGVMLRIVKFAA